MDAKEFLLNVQRYCNSDGKALDELKGFYVSKEYKEFDFEMMIAKVEKWAKENPIKTRQSKFLEMFPNASMIANGSLGICPKSLDKDHACFYQYSDHDGTKIIDCLGCRNKFWFEEVDE